MVSWTIQKLGVSGNVHLLGRRQYEWLAHEHATLLFTDGTMAVQLFQMVTKDVFVSVFPEGKTFRRSVQWNPEKNERTSVWWNSSRESTAILQQNCKYVKLLLFLLLMANVVSLNSAWNPLEWNSTALASPKVLYFFYQTWKILFVSFLSGFFLEGSQCVCVCVLS